MSETATIEELAALRTMTTAHVRKNYWLCESQLNMIRDELARPTGSMYEPEQATVELQAWQDTYLSELVRRGART